MDAVMAAPRAAAAMATVIIEPERRSSMMVSLCLFEVTATDRLRRPQNRWRRLLLPGGGLDPAQRQALPGALPAAAPEDDPLRSEEHTSELQSHLNLVCRLL